MNIIVKLINKVIILINRLIDGMDRKTSDIIRNSFFGIVALLAVIVIIIGYNSGKNSAKRAGKPLTDYTNNVFGNSINKERGSSNLKSMLESELLEEGKKSGTEKLEFPANEKLESEPDDRIVEIGNKDKNKSSGLDDEKIADIDKTDDKLKESDVKEVKKTNLQGKKSDKSSGGPEGKSSVKPEREIKPIDSGSGIIDK